MSTSKTKVYYDGSCPLCVAEISHYAKRDSTAALDLVDVSHSGAELPEGLTQDQAMARFHVQTAQGALVSGAQGFAALWAQVPGWRWLAWLASLPGVLWLMEWAYRGFLRIRPVMVRSYLAWRSKKGPRKAP